MSLLERVSTLLRANLNDLVEKAEDPERLLKQLVLDIENQLLQVKTQVAIAIADEHLLRKKHKEHEDHAGEWKRKATLAVGKGHDDLARSALERSLSHERLAEGFQQQAEDQKEEADTLRQALLNLDRKLAETRARCEMLIAQHRRTNVVGKAAKAKHAAGAVQDTTLNRMRNKIQTREARNEAEKELIGSDSLEDRFAALESEDRVEAMLAELKAKAGM
jgi:phage shock protein A